MPDGRRHGRPIVLALVTAVATAAVVTAGWAARRDDGAAEAPSQAHPANAPVHSEGQVESVPADTAAPPTTVGEAVATTAPTSAAPAPAPTTATRRAAPPPAPVPAATSPPPADPAPEGFTGSVNPIDDATAARMAASWRPGCPVGLADLRLVRLTHWGFDGQARPGEIVVHRDQADRILKVFSDLFSARFPLEQVRLVDEFGGNDDRSMAANNTSAFNCRYVAGTRRWSQHAFGRA
ncbi:MAG TPA: hypothetical protein VFS16_08235, partial [Acidimicrobiia bacterium]|nr:hypothetical protein [Acidimicrobiia bacterium]